MLKSIPLFAAVLLLGGVAAAQSGTINSMSTNPRQNVELSNSTGTESGQPSDSVPGSQSQENGLMPVTSNMVGSGSNGDMGQSARGAKPATAATEAKPAANNNAAPAKNAKPAEKK
jgi:hypothetical protein